MPDFIHRIYGNSKSHLAAAISSGIELFFLKSFLKILVKVLEKNLCKSYIL